MRERESILTPIQIRVTKSRKKRPKEAALEIVSSDRNCVAESEENMIALLVAIEGARADWQ